jgi:hypothetical protein
MTNKVGAMACFVVTFLILFVIPPGLGLLGALAAVCLGVIFYEDMYEFAIEYDFRKRML